MTLAAQEISGHLSPVRFEMILNWTSALKKAGILLFTFLPEGIVFGDAS